VGILAPGSNTPVAAGSGGLGGFEDQLRSLGWIEGRNILLDRRSAEEHYERYQELAAELVRLKVDVIFAAGGPASLKAAMDATKTIPIVMVASSRDPIAEGLIKSFARPGGNVTGLTSGTAEITGKQLELLKEAVPTLARLGVIWDGTVAPFSVTKQFDSVAHSLGVEVLGFEVQGPADFERAVADAGKSKAGATIVASTPMFVRHRQEIADLLRKQRMPAIALWRSQAEAGLLMTYGPSIASQFRSAAIYVDKILRGAKPGELPVEQPSKYDLVINMQTAKALGLALPRSLLVRAGEVIQ
jgi:putative ABC transport system substrate-binding protein